MTKTRELESDIDLCEWSGTDANGDSIDCERQVGGNGPHCIIHSPESVSKSRLHDEVEENAPLCGAVFRTLDLTNSVPALSDNQPLDLTDARIRHLKLDEATISSAVCLEGATIDTITAENAVIKGGVAASGLTCETFEASEVTIEGDLKLSHADISDLLELTESRIECLRADDLTVKGKVRLDDCSFPEQVSIIDSTVTGAITFRYSDFEGRATIENTTFESSLDCRFADFHSQVSFDDSEFHSVARFKQTRFGPFASSFRDTDFHRDATFTEAVSTGVLNFSTTERPDSGEPAVCEGNLRLDDADLYELRLDGVNVDGELSISEASIKVLTATDIQCNTLKVVGTSLGGTAEFSNSTVGTLEVVNSRFGGFAEFDNINVRKSARVKQSVFQSDCDFESTTFLGDVSFERTRFTDRTSFKSVRFIRRAFFFGARFEGTATFEFAEFHELGWFSRRGEQDPIPPVVFGNEVGFHDAIFHTADFSGATFSEPARFDRAYFGVNPRDVTGQEERLTLDTTVDEDVTATRDTGESLSFDDWTPPTETDARSDSDGDGPVKERAAPAARFDHVTFDSIASFNAVTVEVNLQLSDTDVKSLYLTPERVVTDTRIVCKDAAVDTGEIDLTDDEGTQYTVNFKQARVGDVDLSSDAVHTDVFDRCLVKNTRFDGFNFIPHLQELRTLRWEIHHTNSDSDNTSYLDHLCSRLGDYRNILSAWWSDSDSLQTHRNKYQRLQTTYQYAKTGANVTGQNEPASKFFQREMRYQTRNHAAEALLPGQSLKHRIVPFVKSVLIFLFGILSKHGESGSRVVVSSGVIVVAYWVVYLFRPDTSVGLLQNLVFSIGSFATLLTGSIGKSVGNATALVAATEGFVGALMSALLLFTLTRSIHR
ncbi:pentapeptide repeat-containing protein [Halorussus lipolyticus]|uniref:pentapeptide repeat-containing protein n=1 Tax=Halorussus lipolyticus TaxID=3034024 RepID=UPI0023E7E84E|nr:pentapeptide repeat-containing protein [Halorussus sp. DT80]